MIVVDTNIIAYLHLTTEWSQRACDLLQKDADWLAPLLWRSEFRNVLGGYLRKGVLSLEQAKQIMAEALRTMSGREFSVSSNRVLDLTAASACTAYDCEFVALAQDLGIRLVTTDRQILASFPETAISLDEFLGA
jgi:predicted nucleic acid-binding protein